MTCVAVLPNGQVVSGSLDDTLIFWDASDGRRVRQLEGHRGDARPRRPTRVAASGARLRPPRAQVSCVAVLPNGQIVSGSSDKTLRIWPAA